MAQLSTLLMDNWTMQNAGELLHDGFQGDVAPELCFSDDRKEYFYKDISGDLVALECLFQVLNNIVIADISYVDADRMSAWLPHFPKLETLEKSGIVLGRLFENRKDQWVDAREAIVSHFATCPGISTVHQANVEAWSAKEPLPDNILSAVLHGGAGMLARARFARIPYSSHPLRERLLAKAGYLQGPPSALEQVEAFVSSKRLSMFERMDASGYYARLNLPPLAVQVINEASSADDLVTVAVQLRDKYRKLREWVAEFQAALDVEDVKEIRSRQKLLSDLAAALEGKAPEDLLGGTTLQLGITDWLKLTVKPAALVSAIQNRTGVRAQLNHILLSPPGLKAIRRLFGFYDQANTKLALDLERELQKRNAAVAA